ncbi:MAG: caspase family protein [Beijerinckiaceae bacterium]
MKRMCAGWWAALALMLAAPAGAARAQTLPPTEPIPRIETGTQTAVINRIGVNRDCRVLVTASDDKTARLWALPEQGVGAPKLLRVLRVPIGPGHDGKIFAVALSPDGRLVAAGGWNRSGGDHWVYVFDAATGKLIRRLGKLNNVILHLTWSADGRYLAATLFGGEGLRVWETAGWSLVGDDRDYSGKDSYGAAFDARGRLYTVAWDGLLRRYGADFKLEGKRATLGGKEPFSVAVHPNGDRIAVGFNDSTAVEVYRAENLQRLFAADTADVASGNLIAVAWSADGARLYAGGTYRAQGAYWVRIWDQDGRGKGRDMAVAHNTVMQLLPCRDKIAVGTQDPAFGLISLAGEKLVWQESAIAEMRGKLRSNFTVSNDGSKVRFGLGYGDKIPVSFDLATGRLTDQPQPAAGLAEPDTTSLKLSDWEDNRTPKVNGKPLGLEEYELSRSVAIAPGADRFVLGTEWLIRAYDRNGKALWSKPGPGVAWGVNIPRGGRYVVVAYGDGTIRWLRLSDGEEVLALFVNTETREWVLWTPQGYYASSVAGDQNIGSQLNKGWEQAGEFVTAAQLKKHFYRPDVIKRTFDLADADAAVREAGLSGFKLTDLTNHTPPKFRIADPGDKSRADRSPVPVKLELAATDDPVTGFDVTVNGRQVTPRAVRDLPLTTESQIRALNIPLQKGENHIQITAHNTVGDSVQDLLVYLDREGVLDKKGKLFILAIGVDKYPKFPSHWLHYAAADARLMVDTLAKTAGPLHTEVKSKLLVTDGDTPPTAANIQNALLFFHQAGPDDTVVLFLAGHGENEGADYLFMPEDAEEADKNYFLPSTVVKWSVLQQALQDAHGKRIMFVDTCHSGGAHNQRLIKDAADANIVVFSATNSVTEAQEDANLGHGIFTYALAEGLNGKADSRNKGVISIGALFTFVSDEVKDLSKGEQEPTFSVAGVKNFVVARP